MGLCACIRTWVNKEFTWSTVDTIGLDVGGLQSPLNTQCQGDRVSGLRGLEAD